MSLHMVVATRFKSHGCMSPGQDSRTEISEEVPV